MDTINFILPSEDLKTALKKLDANGLQVLFVTDGQKKLLGTLSDGDLRRVILAGVGLNEQVAGFYNTKPMYVTDGVQNESEIRQMFLKFKLSAIPIIDHNGQILSIISWKDAFEGEIRPKHSFGCINIPVVIMAGGKGTRLAPFTNILPKPLIPVGEKTIIEKIIDTFYDYGVKQFYLTVNYRAEMMRAYLDSIDKDYNVEYLKEKDFYGTAGALNLLNGDISNNFIVSNCDILVKANYPEIVDYHKNSGAMLTIISSIHHHTIPYGVVRFQSGGGVTAIDEKPEFTFSINTGVYVLDKACLKYIPDGKLFHMTNLIEALIADGQKVVTYPVNEGDYIDIGQWEEYRNAVEKFGGC
jgi:dTDP-glucose pyrophosphorylase